MSAVSRLGTTLFAPLPKAGAKRVTQAVKQAVRPMANALAEQAGGGWKTWMVGATAAAAASVVPKSIGSLFRVSDAEKDPEYRQKVIRGEGTTLASLAGLSIALEKFAGWASRKIGTTHPNRLLSGLAKGLGERNGVFYVLLATGSNIIAEGFSRITSPRKMDAPDEAAATKASKPCQHPTQKVGIKQNPLTFAQSGPAFSPLAMNAFQATAPLSGNPFAQSPSPAFAARGFQV